jgi:quercetin dioxygenase-like cupin family protein
LFAGDCRRGLPCLARTPEKRNFRAGSGFTIPVQRNQEEKPMMKVLAIACVTVPVIAVSAIAQQPAFKRTVLRSIDYPAGYTTVTVIVEIAPGACTGRHTHPGIDSGYVMQGDFVLKIDGKPEQTLKAGDTYETSPQVPHDACSVSGNKLIDTFVVEKGKPLASPAP